jgi:Domain of unknown function (DUF4397)
MRATGNCRDFNAWGDISMKFRTTLRRVAMSVAALAVIGGIPAAAATTASAATSAGWIRLGNLSAGSSPMDIYLSAGSKVTTVRHAVAYPTVLGYQSANAGSYTVDLRKAGSAASSKPLITGSVSVTAGHAYTVTALQGKLKVLDDSLTAPSGQSLVQVIQASGQSKVTFHCSCAAGAPGNVATDAAPGTVSSYAKIPPGPWTMTASSTSAKGSRFVPLKGNTVHTEVVVNTTTGLGILDLLSAAGDAPTVGGVATGLGGTAPQGPGSPLPWLVAIGAGAALLLGGGFRLSRTRDRRLVARR